MGSLSFIQMFDLFRFLGSCSFCLLMLQVKVIIMDAV
jgi:hypothetical protein